MMADRSEQMQKQVDQWSNRPTVMSPARTFSYTSAGRASSRSRLLTWPFERPTLRETLPWDNVAW